MTSSDHPATSFVIRLHGLCGAGKTTLSRLVARELNATIFEIGRYRRRGRAEPVSWDLMVCDIERLLRTGGRALVATTGVNLNEFVIDYEFPEGRKVWLGADLVTLDARVAAKPLLQRGYLNWLSLPIYRKLGSKPAFNHTAFTLYEELSKDEGLTIDARLPPDTLCGLIADYLRAEGFQWPARQRG